MKKRKEMESNDNGNVSSGDSSYGWLSDHIWASGDSSWMQLSSDDSLEEGEIREEEERGRGKLDQEVYMHSSLHLLPHGLCIFG